MVTKRKILNVFVLTWILAASVVVFRADGSASSLTRPAAVPTPPANTEAEHKTNKAFKGISVGMQAAEVRTILGEPKEKGDTQDFYVFSETESGQIVYDSQHAVTAISFDFTGKSIAPVPKDVLGIDVPPGADGALYKLIRFPKAGYWVSYNRTAGTEPMVSITMQKIP